jgi:hypothetical protein
MTVVIRPDSLGKAAGGKPADTAADWNDPPLAVVTMRTTVLGSAPGRGSATHRECNSPQPNLRDGR